MFEKKAREINIFNMSAIDLFASAFGAFLLITLILFPYYLRVPRTVLAELSQCREELSREREARQQCESRLQQANAQVAECRNALETCESKLRATFLMVRMNWDRSGTDVDLHIFDPSGAHFYYQQKIVPGRPGIMTEDDTGGGSLQEVWIIFNDAPAGDYVVAYDLYSGSTTNVDGNIYSRHGETSIPTVRLSTRCRQVGVVRVGNDGSVNFVSGGNRVGSAAGGCTIT